MPWTTFEGLCLRWIRWESPESSCKSTNFHYTTIVLVTKKYNLDKHEAMSYN